MRSTTYILSRIDYHMFRTEHEEDAGNASVRWLSETCEYPFFVRVKCFQQGACYAYLKWRACQI